jgi:hypothetical protein
MFKNGSLVIAGRDRGYSCPVPFDSINPGRSFFNLTIWRFVG